MFDNLWQLACHQNIVNSVEGQLLPKSAQKANEHQQDVLIMKFDFAPEDIGDAFERTALPETDVNTQNEDEKSIRQAFDDIRRSLLNDTLAHFMNNKQCTSNKSIQAVIDEINSGSFDVEREINGENYRVNTYINDNGELVYNGINENGDKECKFILNDDGSIKSSMVASNNGNTRNITEINYNANNKIEIEETVNDDSRISVVKSYDLTTGELLEARRDTYTSEKGAIDTNGTFVPDNNTSAQTTSASKNNSDSTAERASELSSSHVLSTDTSSVSNINIDEPVGSSNSSSGTSDGEDVVVSTPPVILDGDNMYSQLVSEFQQDGYDEDDATLFAGKYYQYINNGFTPEEAAQGAKDYALIHTDIMSNNNLSAKNANELLKLYNQFYLELKSSDKAIEKAYQSLSD